MKFDRTLISVLSIIIATQYFAHQRIIAHPKNADVYPTCDRTKHGSKVDRLPKLTSSPEQLKKTSYWTEYFFYLIRPEMKGKKIQAAQTLYRQEKTGIRQIVRQVFSCSCYWSKKNYYLIKQYIPEDKQNKHFWQWEYYWLKNDNYWFDGLYSDFTDAVFYARHPELNRDKSYLENMNLATEWMFIRQHLVSFDTENMLKKEFIPTCDRDAIDKIWTSLPAWYLDKKYLRED